MNQLCKVCGEPAAGFHFGAFTCEGCKSFFGRTYNNISAIAGCKNNGDCVINKKNRTACKACRLRKCLLVGMSKSGSRYGRRSNWFKIHCLLQEQQTQHTAPSGAAGGGGGSGGSGGGGASSFEQLARLHQMQARQTYQDKTNPCIKTASSNSSMSPTLTLPPALSQSNSIVGGAPAASNHNSHSNHNNNNNNSSSNNNNSVTSGGDDSAAQHSHTHAHNHPHHQHHHHATVTPDYMSAAKFLNGIDGSGQVITLAIGKSSESRISDTPSDSGASSAGDGDADAGADGDADVDDDLDDCLSVASVRYAAAQQRHVDTDIAAEAEVAAAAAAAYERVERERRRKQFLQIFRSHSEPLRSPFAAFAISNLPPPPILAGAPPAVHFLPALNEEMKRVAESSIAAVAAVAATTAIALDSALQDEPIDLSLKARHCRTPCSGGSGSGLSSPTPADAAAAGAQLPTLLCDVIQKPAPLDLTLARSQTLTG